MYLKYIHFKKIDKRQYNAKKIDYKIWTIPQIEEAIATSVYSNCNMTWFLNKEIPKLFFFEKAKHDDFGLSFKIKFYAEFKNFFSHYRSKTLHKELGI